MSSEWIAIILTAICMFGGLVGQAIYITWHASRWNTTMEFMQARLAEMAGAMRKLSDGNYTRADAKTDFEKRDDLVKKLWEKFDDLKDDFILLRGKVDAHLLEKGGGEK